MKKIVYLLGLLNITIPNLNPVHKDSQGNPITPLNIAKEKATLYTVYPNNNSEWNVTPQSCHEWIGEMHVGRVHSRYIVNSDSTVIINKNKLVLERVEKTFS